MSAGGIIPDPVIIQSQESAAGFSEGDMVDAQVVKDLGDGKYRIRAGGSQMVVQSEEPLSTEQQLTLEVVKAGGKPVFQVVTADAPAPVPTEQTAIPAILSLNAEPAAVAQHLSAAPAGETVQIEVTVQGESFALRMPDGAIEQVMVQEPVPGGMQRGAFLVEQSLLHVELVSSSGTTATAQIAIPVQDLPQLVQMLEQIEPGQALPIEQVQAAQGQQETVVVRVAGEMLELQLPEGTVAQGEQVTLNPQPTTMLGGVLSTEATVSVASAADAHLQAIGLTPSDTSRAAVSALIGNHAPVERELVQALIAAGAGRSGEEHAAFLDSAARILAKDIPLAAPLVVGGESAGPPITSLLADTLVAINEAAQVVAEAVPAEVQAPVQGAPAEGQAQVPVQGSAVGENLSQALYELGNLLVELGRGDTPEQLSEFFQHFGRESFGRASEAIENATTQLLASNPRLLVLDAALTELLDIPSLPVAPQPPAHPGALSPEMDEVVRMVRSLIAQSSGSSQNEAVQKIAQEIVESDPVRAQIIARQVVESGDQNLVRQLAVKLEEIEQETIAREPAVIRLSDAADALRAAGRRMLACKAESIAGMRQDPATFVAEVPFRLDGEAGGGRLQFFSRRSSRRGKGAPWNSRVVLDLQTTAMGPVVGDMRFFGQEVALTLFAATQEIAEYLGSGAGELTSSLREKGFALQPRFLVIPDAGDEVDGAPPARYRVDGSGRLDVRV